MHTKRILIGLICLCLAVVFLVGNAGLADTSVTPSSTPTAQPPTVHAGLPQRTITQGKSRSATATAHVTAGGSRDAAMDADFGQHSRARSTTLPAQPTVQTADALQPTPDAGPLNADQALAELRLLQQAQGPKLDAGPTTTPTGSSMPTSAPAGPFPKPGQIAARPLPPLAVGALLPGMPEYIVIGRSYGIDCSTPARDLPTERMRFVDYLRNVLPNEWVTTWPPAALDAGAIAVKQFAWYTVVIQRKWRSQGYLFDIVDNTCDQYFRDGSADPRTDAAIQRTWGTVLMRNGSLLPTYYRDTEVTCGGARDCMGQVESAVLASTGQSALQILARYFNAPGTGVLVTGGQLPAQLPPVPPAPPIVIRPSQTATARPQSTTAPSPTSTPTLALVAPPVTTPPGEPTPNSTAGAATGTPARRAPTETAIFPTFAPTSTTRTATPSGSVLTPTTLPPTPSPTATTPPVVMPQLVGLGEVQAKAALAKLGTFYVIVDYQGRDRLGDLYDKFPPYAVVSHSPAAGTLLRPGQIVRLGVRAP